ncbi:MAG: Periplasmic thiol:disulfide oxidoreductase DsbB, required for DsbA reoxidation, partial [uncultured Sphingomonas sp.]
GRAPGQHRHQPRRRPPAPRPMAGDPGARCVARRCARLATSRRPVPVRDVLLAALSAVGGAGAWRALFLRPARPAAAGAARGRRDRDLRRDRRVPCGSRARLVGGADPLQRDGGSHPRGHSRDTADPLRPGSVLLSRPVSGRLERAYLLVCRRSHRMADAAPPL